MRVRPSLVAAVTLGVALATATAGTPVASAGTEVKPYLVTQSDDYTVTPLLSVADTVPETSHPNLSYQMVGIPDGLAAYRNDQGIVTVLMNHELTAGTLSEPVVGEPLNEGAIVSRLLLDDEGNVMSGERAYDFVYQENTFVGPAAQDDNDTPDFARFCSASVAGPDEGFDRHIYFTNEESEGANTFDGLGGQTVAIFDNEAHALPRLGRFAKEDSLVMANTAEMTVIMTLEDGPTTPDSQLYMYVGRKDRSPGASVLRRNGLDNGRLYVFVSTTPGKTDELSFQGGRIRGRWTPILGAQSMSDTELEEAADAAGAFSFIRIEDGAFNKSRSREFYFVTTGGNEADGNGLGRLYHLTLNKNNPNGIAQLRVLYNADRVIADGGDIAISPDNLDTSRDYLMIQEDGTSSSRPVMEDKDRDGSVWRFAIDGVRVDVESATRVLELDPPGRDGIEVDAGIWESSGIIDTSDLFGEGSWLLDVQAHPPTTAPAPNTVEDGQLLLILPA